VFIQESAAPVRVQAEQVRQPALGNGTLPGPDPRPLVDAVRHHPTLALGRRAPHPTGLDQMMLDGRVQRIPIAPLQRGK